MDVQRFLGETLDGTIYEIVKSLDEMKTFYSWGYHGKVRELDVKHDTARGRMGEMHEAKLREAPAYHYGHILLENKMQWEQLEREYMEERDKLQVRRLASHSFCAFGVQGSGYDDSGLRVHSRHAD